MNKNDKSQEELLKSLASELDMSETEIKAYLEKAEEIEVAEAKKEDEEEEEKTEKSEEQEIMKSIKSEFEKLKEINSKKEQPKKEDLNKSEDNDIVKSLETLREGFTSFKDDFQKSMEDSLSEMVSDKLEKSLNGFGEKLEELSKSIELIGESSQGTKGVMFNNYMKKSGDNSPIEKDGKTFISSSDRNAISESMVTIIEKSEDDSLKSSVTADLINYQATGNLTEFAVQRLNKAGIMFKEQMND